MPIQLPADELKLDHATCPPETAITAVPVDAGMSIPLWNSVPLPPNGLFLMEKYDEI